MAGTYHLPSNTSYVSDSWQGHINRKPPSTEPGTDYGAASGSPLYAVGPGRVYEVKTTSSGAMGRYITIDLDDGRRTRSLHLSKVSVSAGARVTRGQVIGKTGASAYGSEWGVGAHVHQTLWPTKKYVFGCCPPGTIDFAKYVGNPVPPEPPLAPTQRKVKSNTTSQGRMSPTTASPLVNTLAANQIGNFDGWVNGETISGNKVWFRGAGTQAFYWSGNFTDTGTHNLTNLNTGQEDEDMANTGYYYPRSGDGVTVFGIINTESGYNSEWSGTTAAYNNAMAAAFRTGSFVSITLGHRNALVNALPPIRPQSLTGLTNAIASLDDDDVRAAVEAQPEAPTPIFDSVVRARQG